MSTSDSKPDKDCRAAWPPERLAVGVVLYHPRPDAELLIEVLVRQFDGVFVVENESRAKAGVEPRDNNPEGSSLHWSRNADNRGLAVAINQLCDAARRHGYDWIVLFDQDSRVPTDFRSRLTDCIASLNKPPGLLAANYETWLLGDAIIGYTPGPGPGVHDVVVALNSGSMIDLMLHHQLGGHDETFFVDHVDHEYCLRLRRHGAEILATRTPLFEHQVGNVVCVRRLGRIWQSSGHPPTRRREWACNLVRLVKRYWKPEPGWCARRLFIELPRSVLAMVLLEPHRGSKLKAVFGGLYSGITRSGQMRQ